jgi:hypothetical protein
MPARDARSAGIPPSCGGHGLSPVKKKQPVAVRPSPTMADLAKLA